MRCVKAGVAVVTVLALACDGSEEPRATSPADSAVEISVPASRCPLVAEAALEQAVGFDVVVNRSAGGNCIATPADGAVSAPTIDFRIEPRTAAFDYYSAQADATPIAGLGDRAVWSTVNETTGYVVAITGTSAVVVGIGKADGVNQHSRRQAESVARLLLRSP